MNIRPLINFARHAPDPGVPHAPPIPYANNTAYIKYLQHVLHAVHIQSPGIITFQDVLTARATHQYLKALLAGKPDDTIDAPRLISSFAQTVRTLRDKHYTPLAEQSKIAADNHQTEWEHLNNRYFALIDLCAKDITYADILHDEFLMDGQWAPEKATQYTLLKLSPQSPKIISISRIEALREVRQFLRQNIQEHGTNFLEILIPENLESLNQKQRFHHNQHAKNQNAIHALSALSQNLQTITSKPEKRILPFPKRRAAQPVSRP